MSHEQSSTDGVLLMGKQTFFMNSEIHEWRKRLMVFQKLVFAGDRGKF